MLLLRTISMKTVHRRVVRYNNERSPLSRKVYPVYRCIDLSDWLGRCCVCLSVRSPVLSFVKSQKRRRCGHKQTHMFEISPWISKVPHRLLLKLDYYGIRGSTHKWISSRLSWRSQRVVLGGQASDPVPVLSGVPQGSVLGPLHK